MAQSVGDATGREGEGETESEGESPERANRPVRNDADTAVNEQRVPQPEDAIERVEREEEPRWRRIQKGRALLSVYAVIYVLALLAAGGLAFAAHAYSRFPGDLTLTRDIQASHNTALFALLYAVSFIGYPLESGIILVVLALLLWVVRLRVAAVFLVLTLIADGVTEVIKQLVARHRPSVSLVNVTQHITSPSFPSGHTVHYTVFYGFLAFVLVTSFRPHWVRTILIALCVALVILVGPSRVYLGEHWTSDVVGGYLIGALCLLPLILGYLKAEARWGRSRARASSTEGTERRRGRNGTNAHGVSG